MKKATILILILSLAVTILACQSQNNPSNGKTISIKGIARNSKAGAVIQAKEGVFHLEGLASWNDDTLNKAIRVKGEVVEMPAEPDRDADGGYRQVIGGPYTVIKNPTWKRIN